MKARVPIAAVSGSGSAAMMREIRAQCVELNRSYELECDALWLWALHTEKGYGIKRLTDIYDAVLRQRKELHDAYKSDSSLPERDMPYYAARCKLSDYGFSLSEEFQKLNQKYKI